MTPQPDFLRPTARPHRLAWLACATALAVLGLAASDTWQAWQAREEAMAPPPEPQRLPAVAAPAPASAAHLALQAALARLDRPWPTAFHALEAVQVPGLAWLALGIDEAGGLHLEGQAGDTAAALAAARLLRRQAAWRDVVLGRMERSAGGPLQFEIHATAGAGS